MLIYNICCTMYNVQKEKTKEQKYRIYQRLKMALFCIIFIRLTRLDPELDPTEAHSHMDLPIEMEILISAYFVLKIATVT